MSVENPMYCLCMRLQTLRWHFSPMNHSWRFFCYINWPRLFGIESGDRRPRTSETTIWRGCTFPVSTTLHIRMVLFASTRCTLENRSATVISACCHYSCVPSTRAILSSAFNARRGETRVFYYVRANENEMAERDFQCNWNVYQSFRDQVYVHYGC